MASRGKIARFRVTSRAKLISIMSLYFSAFTEAQYFPVASRAFPTNTNLDECQAANIPCGGHTQPSCMRYCINAGYTKGTCEGTCCLCTKGEIGQQMTSSNTAYFNMGTIHGSTLLNIRRSGTPLGSVNGLNTTQPKLMQTPMTSIFHLLNRHNSTAGNTAYFNVGGGINVGIIGSGIINSQQNKYNSVSNQIVQNQIQHASNKPIKPPHDNYVYNTYNMGKPLQRPPFSPKDICSTSTCKNEAQVIKSQMNERADPCDDFYQFACGGFLRKHRIPKDQTEVTHFSILRDKVADQLRELFEEKIQRNEAKPFKLVKTFYKSCMNTRLIESQGFQPLLKVLEDIGGWAVLVGDAWQPQDEFKWENFVVWYRELGFSLDYFMKISVEPDMRNVGKRYITIGEPVLSLSDQVLKRGLNEPIVNAYYNYMIDTAILMGADRTKAKKEMLDTVNFEISLAQCFHRPGNSRSGTFYNPMTIQQLSTKIPFIPWLAFFQRIIPSKVSITDQEVIMVSVPQYLDCFFNLLQKTEQKTMVNYIVWRAVSGSVIYLHESARALQQNFVSKITGQKERKPRWKECTEIVQTTMGNAVGAMYIRRFFKDASKAQAMEMVKNIQRAFLDILNEIEWMDPYTKGKAREKALEMLVHIGYPEEHKSDAKISPVYAPFNFKDTDYFGNVRHLVNGAMTTLFGKLREPITRNDWLAHGQNAVVNAFYQPQENSIQFPAAILQGHFFNATRPKYLNYAAIGWIIGHEQSHGFDNEGHQFDKHGNHLNWWAESTKETYNQKKQCIVDQYSAFQSHGLRLNGERSQGENIADNGGIKQAYRGYKYWVTRNGKEKSLPGLKYTPDQLFWISAAQNWCAVERLESIKHNIVAGVHSPPEFRVRGTFSNNVDFAKDFKCAKGRKMNPTKKCSVW